MEPDNSPGGKPALYFEDLYVGQRFVSSSVQVDETQIREFAQNFDPQPFHLDAEAAKETFFGELVASGWHTSAITMRLMVIDGLSLAGGLIGAGAELNWPKPTRPGSVLHVESEIIELKPLRSRPDRGIAIMRSETIDQLGEVVQVLVAKVLVSRKP